MKIVHHYDLEYTEAGGDYTYVTVETDDGEVLAEYGDHYHDKGTEKAEGFVQGWYAAKDEDYVEPTWEDREFRE